MSEQEPGFGDDGVPSLNDRLTAELPEVGPQDLGVWVDERADAAAAWVGRLMQPKPDHVDHEPEPIGEGSDDREGLTTEEAALRAVVEP
jgi:hypothetical protein